MIEIDIEIDIDKDIMSSQKGNKRSHEEIIIDDDEGVNDRTATTAAAASAEDQQQQQQQQQKEVEPMDFAELVDLLDKQDEIAAAGAKAAKRARESSPAPPEPPTPSPIARAADPAASAIAELSKLDDDDDESNLPPKDFTIIPCGFGTNRERMIEILQIFKMEPERAREIVTWSMRFQYYYMHLELEYKCFHEMHMINRKHFIEENRDTAMEMKKAMDVLNRLEHPMLKPDTVFVFCPFMTPGYISLNRPLFPSMLRMDKDVESIDIYTTNAPHLFVRAYPIRITYFAEVFNL